MACRPPWFSFALADEGTMHRPMMDAEGRLDGPMPGYSGWLHIWEGGVRSMCTQAQSAGNVDAVKHKQGRDREKRTFHRSTDPFHCISFIVNVEAGRAVRMSFWHPEQHLQSHY